MKNIFVLMVVLCFFSTIAAQNNLSVFKKELPNEIFYNLDFVKKVENQINMDLLLSYRLVYFKIEELKGGYSVVLHNSDDVSLPDSRYTSLKNYYQNEKHKFLGELLQNPFLETLETKDDIISYIQKLMKQYQTPENILFLQENSDVEKIYATRYLNLAGYKDGTSPDEILETYYKSKLRTLRDRLEKIRADHLKVRPELLDELINSYIIFTKYASADDLLELLDIYFERPVEEEYVSNFHIDLGIVSGFLSDNDVFKFTLDNYTPEFIAGNGEPEAMLMLNIGGKIPVREHRVIGSYLDIGLSAGLVLSTEYESEFNNLNIEGYEGNDKINDIYLFDGSEISNPRVSVFHMELNTPVFFIGKVVVFEVGAVGTLLNYSFDVKGRLWYYTIVNNISHKNDIKEDISSSHSFTEFKISPSVNILAAVISNINVAMKFNFNYSTVAVRYNLPF